MIRRRAVEPRSSRPSRCGRVLRSAIEKLRVDFAAEPGRPFTHFQCPILFRDEPAELCRGHIANQAFRMR